MAASLGIRTSMAAAAATEEEEEMHRLLGVGPEIGSHKPLQSPGKGKGDLEAELAWARRIAATALLRARGRGRGCLPFPLFGEKKKKLVPVARDISKYLEEREKKQLEERERRYFQERERLLRSILPGRLESLAMDRRFVEECLQHYNAAHPGDEYEPAPGEVTRHREAINEIAWTHGNFVARRKHTGCFSILPAPRTIFFFEIIDSADFKGVVTCIPLDEPVTEAYSILGFPLWWTTRRNGRLDCICKTCYRHYDVPHPFIIGKTYPCGHNKVERVCEMCYRRSGVLHPFPGEFAYGYREYSYRHRRAMPRSVLA